MSRCEAPASKGGFPFSMPPVAISVLNEFWNTQPSLTPLPASDRSCQYGGSSSPKDRVGSIRPALRSNFQNVIRPRYFSLYWLIGAYLCPSGTAYCDPSTT